jgi:hypothetical protein
MVARPGNLSIPNVSAAICFSPKPHNPNPKAAKRSLREGVPSSKIAPLVKSIAIFGFLDRKCYELQKNHIS